MLDANPALAIPGESHFIPPLWRARRRYERDGAFDEALLAEDLLRVPHVRAWGVPESVMRAYLGNAAGGSFADIVSAAFDAYAAHHGKVRWGDKTPIYVLDMPLLADLFPDARFVHLIRDGRDVTLSYLSVSWGPRSVWEAARKWRRDVTAGRLHGQELGKARYLELRYEDLVADPRTWLETVCAFADLAFDERMLEHNKDWRDRVQAPPGGAERWHRSVAKPVTEGLRDWRTQMAERDVRAFETIAGRLLTDLGYERRFPRIGLARRAGAGLRVGWMESVAAGSRAKKAFNRARGRAPAKIDRGR